MKFLLLIVCIIYSIISVAQTPDLVSSEFNFTSFHKREKVVTPELLSLIPVEFRHHPDFGIQPKSKPAGNFMELIHKRTDSTRTFIDIKHPNNFAIQKGYGPMHFTDANGNLIERDFDLYPTTNQGVYKTRLQPNIVSIDTNAKEISISFNHSVVSFSKNLKLIYQDSNQVKTTIASANWSHFKAGSNGFYITDFFPNIDYYGIVNENSIKTNFKVKSNITSSYSHGYLIISDQVDSDINSQYIPSSALDHESKFVGDLQIYNPGSNNFTIHQGVCYDKSRNEITDLFYRKLNSCLEMLVDFVWLNNSALQYPVIIDPTISTNGSLAQASCDNSRKNNSCNFTNSCDYNLTVNTPANATITDVQWSFDYKALGSCYMSDGAVRFSYLGCTSPSLTGYYWFCNVGGQGVCSGSNISLFNDFGSCIPAPLCVPYAMIFTLKFYRSCYGSSGCSNDCIKSNSPWVMTIYGKTLETLANNATGSGSQSLSPACNSTQVLNPSPGNGVGPYTYLWTPGGQTTSTKTISTFFLGTQVFTCQVTDACGTTRIATFNVSPLCVLPVELLAFNATVNSNNIHLFWETASETNSSHFVLERSYDAEHFIQIANIPGAGNSTSYLSYSFIDREVDMNDIVYYRLKQFDIGSNVEKYASLISVESNDLKSIDVYPNPSNGIYEIIPEGNYSEKTYDISVFNYIGEEVFQKNGIKSKSTVDLLNFPSGIYLLKIDINGKIVHKNLIKE